MTKLTATYFILLSFCITGFVTKVKQSKRPCAEITGKSFNAAKLLFKMDSIYEAKYFESTIGVSDEKVIAVP